MSSSRILSIHYDFIQSNILFINQRHPTSHVRKRIILSSPFFEVNNYFNQQTIMQLSIWLTNNKRYQFDQRTTKIYLFDQLKVLDFLIDGVGQIDIFETVYWQE